MKFEDLKQYFHSVDAFLPDGDFEDMLAITKDGKLVRVDYDSDYDERDTGGDCIGFGFWEDEFDDYGLIGMKFRKLPKDYIEYWCELPDHPDIIVYD